MVVQLDTNWLIDFQTHAKESYPNECVGYVKDGVYQRLINTHPQPDKHFRIPIDLFLTVNPDMVLHSHPHHGQPHSNWPSLADLECFYAHPQCKWGILATDGVECSDLVLFDDNNPADLVGREYIWGVQDCYSVIRDWYKINRRIILKNYPRDYHMHQSGDKTYYEDKFADAGFVEVGVNDIQIGDVLLLSINTRHVNHAAIVIGEDTILHHWVNRLSDTDSLSKWLRATKRVVRYAKD